MPGITENELIALCNWARLQGRGFDPEHYVLSTLPVEDWGASADALQEIPAEDLALIRDCFLDEFLARIDTYDTLNEGEHDDHD